MSIQIVMLLEVAFAQLMIDQAFISAGLHLMWGITGERVNMRRAYWVVHQVPLSQCSLMENIKFFQKFGP
jgi:hypothetical protein